MAVMNYYIVHMIYRDGSCMLLIIITTKYATDDLLITFPVTPQDENDI